MTIFIPTGLLCQAIPHLLNSLVIQIQILFIPFRRVLLFLRNTFVEFLLFWTISESEKNKIQMLNCK